MRSFRTNYQGASARDTADRLYARNRPKRLCTFARLSMRRIVTKAPSIKLWVRRILLIPGSDHIASALAARRNDKSLFPEAAALAGLGLRGMKRTDELSGGNRCASPCRLRG